MELKKTLIPFILTLVLLLLSIIVFIAYQKQAMNTKLIALIPVVDRIVQQTTIYANANGHFPSLQQLGLTEQNTIQTLGNDAHNPDAMNSYIVNLEIADISLSKVKCGQAGIINGDLAGVAFSCFLQHKNGAINSKCSYYLNSTGKEILRNKRESTEVSIDSACI